MFFPSTQKIIQDCTDSWKVQNTALYIYTNMVTSKKLSLQGLSQNSSFTVFWPHLSVAFVHLIVSYFSNKTLLSNSVTDNLKTYFLFKADQF